MKIMMLSSFYPPIIGGMGKHVQSVSRELVKRGHEVVVCTTSRQDLPACEDDAGVKVLRLQGALQRIPFLFKDPEKRHHPPVYDWSIGKGLKHTIEEYQPDIINAHGWMLYSLLPLVKRYDIPLIVSLMDCEFICPKQSLMGDEDGLCDHPFRFGCIACGMKTYGLMKSTATYFGIRNNRRKLGLVDKFIAISSFTKQINARHLCLQDEDVAVIPCFYEPDAEGRIVDSKNASGLPNDFILFVGALSPHKGVGILLEAYRRLDTRVKLVLIGSSHPDYSYKTGDNVVVIENAPRHTVLEAMSKCRFAVFPSIWAEGFGLVAIEAMSHKKAVIASDIGGLKDIVVDSETGFLVAPGEVDKLAGAIEHLLQNPQESVEMGLRGYERFIRCFTPDAIMPRIIKVYNGMVNHSSPY